MDRGIKMELSEEEKKAIELLKKLQKKTPYIIWGDGTPYNKNNQIQTILNLIDKKQKEIEKLKFNNHMVRKWNEYLDKDCISKNRIKEIIKKYIDIEEALNYTNQEIYGEDLKNMILELLGEN